LQELLNFFGTASVSNAIKEQTIAELYSYVSLQSQSAAMTLAKIAFNSSNKNNLLKDFRDKI